MLILGYNVINFDYYIYCKDKLSCIYEIKYDGSLYKENNNLFILGKISTISITSYLSKLDYIPIEPLNFCYVKMSSHRDMYEFFFENIDITSTMNSLFRKNTLTKCAKY